MFWLHKAIFDIPFNLPAYTMLHNTDTKYTKSLTLQRTLFNNFALCHTSIECFIWECLSAIIMLWIMYNSILQYFRRDQSIPSIFVTAVEESIVISATLILSWMWSSALWSASCSMFGDLFWTFRLSMVLLCSITFFEVSMSMYSKCKTWRTFQVSHSDQHYLLSCILL